MSDMTAEVDAKDMATAKMKGNEPQFDSRNINSSVLAASNYDNMKYPSRLYSMEWRGVPMPPPRRARTIKIRPSMLRTACLISAYPAPKKGAINSSRTRILSRFPAKAKIASATIAA